MPKLRLCSGFLCMVLVAAANGRACAETAAATPTADWKAAAAKEGLSPEEIARLEKDKVLVSHKEKFQSFSAYIGQSPSLFITSDAVLNAYHVLFEETLRRHEKVNAGMLRSLWSKVWKTLPKVPAFYDGDKPLISAAHFRAQFVVGVAVKLLGGDLGNPPPALQHAIDQEVATILAAQGQHKPSALGPPESDFVAFDDTLFRPTGFYDTTESLRGYFRAVRWLQLVPFRVDKPEEWLALHMLKKCEDWEAAGPSESSALQYVLWEYQLANRMFSGDATPWLFQNFKGDQGKDGRLQVDDALFQSVAAEAKEFLRQTSPGPSAQIPDRLREPSKGGWHPEYRLLGTLVLPEQTAMSAADHSTSKSGPSGGLEFDTWLGLPLAKKLLIGSKDEPRLSALTEHRLEKTFVDANPYWAERYKDTPWWRLPWQELPMQWRAVLRELGEVDPRAPAFMRGEPWQLKTLQTVAASWAQDRHAWSLQAQPEVHVLSATMQPAGFVEPTPLFYGQLGSVANEMGALAEEIEQNIDPVGDVIEAALALAKEQRRIASGPMTKDDAFSADWEAGQFTEKYGVHDARTDKATSDSLKALREALHPPDDGRNPEPNPPPTADDLRANAERFEQFAARLRTETLPGSDLWRRLQRETLHTPRLWHQLERLCEKLTELSQEQLSGSDFTEIEQNQIQQMGYELSEIMLFRGQAAQYPPDNASRIVRLSSDPRSGKIFQVGIGRPRLLYVLYPWKGQEVFCRGVVMPYHEVCQDTALSDETWRDRFREGPHPTTPDWLKGFVPAEAKPDIPRH